MSVHRPKRLGIVVSIGAVVALVATVAVWSLAAPSREPVANTTISEPSLTERIAAQLALERGQYRVAVREIGGDGRVVSIDATQSMEPASSIKLFFAWLVFRRVDQGTLRLDSRLPTGERWGQCLRVMIVVSDNLCAAEIREALGNEWVNRAFATAGFANTRILLSQSGDYLSKRSSPADLAELLVRLESGELLSAESTTAFHRLLRDQVWRARIAGGTPAGVVVESKPGELLVDNRMVETDAAIVRGPVSTYVIAMMGDHNATKVAFRHVSRIVYEELQHELVVTRATYPRLQYTARSGATFRSTFGGPVVTVIPVGRAIRLKYTYGLNAYVRVDDNGWGWVPFSALRLRDEFRWLG